MLMTGKGKHSEPVAKFQILLVGDAGVGKTSFIQSYRAEQGAHVARRNRNVHGLPQAAIIVFDVTSRATYQKGRDIDAALGTIPKVLVANKIDLPKKSHEVDAQQVRLYCGKRVQFYGMSVLTRFNIEKPFLWLARRLVNQPRLELIGNYAMFPKAYIPSTLVLDHERQQGEAQLVRVQSTASLAHERLGEAQSCSTRKDDSAEECSDLLVSQPTELSSECSSDCRARKIALRDVRMYVERAAREFSWNASPCEGRFSAEDIYASDIPEDEAGEQLVQNLDGVWLSSEGEPVAVVRGSDVHLLGDAEGLKTSISEVSSGIWSITIADEEFLGDCQELEGGQLVLQWSDGETWKRRAAIGKDDKQDMSTDASSLGSARSDQHIQTKDVSTYASSLGSSSSEHHMQTSENEKPDACTDAFDSSSCASSRVLQTSQDAGQDLFMDGFHSPSSSSTDSSSSSDSSTDSDSTSSGTATWCKS